MSTLPKIANRPGRPEFREWLDRQEAPQQAKLPLIHTAKALVARDIVRDGEIRPRECSVIGRSVSYFFYGRPAYRPRGNAVVTQNSMCPVCFVFSENLLDRASNIFPFDTGAFAARLYKHAMIEEANIPDFDISGDLKRIGRLISRIFENNENYILGDRSKLRSIVRDAEPDEYLAQAYIDLITSRGQNEPDDRVATIEVVVDETVDLGSMLLSIVVPDNIWNKSYSAEWLKPFSERGVSILPYRHTMGREPSHYHDAIEVQVREFLANKGLL